MITVKSITPLKNYSNNKNKEKNIIPAIEHCQNSGFYPQNITTINYGPSLINFRGKNAIHLSQVSNLNDINLLKIVYDIKKSGKKPIIISDYDGTHTDFGKTRMSAVPTAKPHIGVEEFLNLNNNLNNNGIPIITLTTRSFEKLKDPNIMGGKIADSINVVCLNGNQIRLTLNKNTRTNAYIKQWQEKTDYKTKIEELGSNKIKLKIDPIIPQELKNIEESYQKELAPLGFEFNNESLIQYLKWNKLFQATQEATEEKPLVMKVNDTIFKNINNSIKDKNNSTKKLITIQNSQNESCKISYDEIIDYGLEKFKQICQKEYGEKLSDKKIGSLTSTELASIKAITSDERHKRFYEIADIRAKANNKGHSVESLSKLFGEKDKDSFPVFLGDSVSGQNDDEFAMRKTSELKGIGIAILKGNSNDNIRDRYALTTQADYRLGSFEDTAPFLRKFAELMKSKVVQ